METSRQDLVQRFSALMERSFGLMQVPNLGEFSSVELTMPQLGVLLFLYQESRRMSDVAAYLGVGLSSTTSMIDRLEAKRLVERQPDPADRRVVRCHLTSLGRDEVERFWHLNRMRVEEMAHLLTPAELETIVRDMETIVAALERRREGMDLSIPRLTNAVPGIERSER
ncbi:MAG: MarR family transcriptional regulator [Chloroflexi bacterium]|nr:MarR family transcriptional regulator [Chloroflexota bacterium]